MIATWAVVLIAWAAVLVGFLMGAWWASIPREPDPDERQIAS